MAKEITALKESLLDVMVKYNEVMNSGDVSQKRKEEVSEKFRSIKFHIEMFVSQIEDIEDKTDSLVDKFEDLPDEKKIQVLAAIRPELKIYPVSYVNDYVKNELNGDCLKFMNSIEQSDLTADNSTYFVVNTKHNVIMFEDCIDGYAVYEKKLEPYLKKHPELFEK